MSNRTVEANLKLSAKLGPTGAFGQMAGKLNKLERQSEALNRAQSRLGGTMRRAESSLAAYGKAAGALAVGAGLGAVIRTTADYETRLVSIQKKLGATDAQMAELGKSARGLATSGDLAVPLEEILSAYERGAAAGLPLDELKEFATLSAKAADAFEMSAEDVGNAAAGFKVSMGIPINQMQRYFDLINGLADAGIADEKDIVDFADRAGAALKNFGLANEDIAALGATLLNLKMPAEVGARAMSTLTTKMLTPKATKASAAAFAELYGSADKFTALLKKDARGAMVDFLKRVRELDKFKQAKVLSGILGQGFSDEVQRLSGGLDEFIRNLEYVDGKSWFDSLGKSYGLKLNTLASKWQVFKNELNELSIDVGTMGMPALEAGLETAKGLVSDIQAGLGGFKATIDLGAFQEARIAFGEAKNAWQDLLNITPSNNAIVDFFHEGADAANDIAGAIAKVSSAMKEIADTIRNPSKLLEVTPHAQLPGRLGGLIATDEEAAGNRQARMAEEARRRETARILDRARSGINPNIGIRDALMADPGEAVLEDRLTRFLGATIPSHRTPAYRATHLGGL